MNAARGMQGRGAVLATFAWLQATSLVNIVRARLRRLRQPKYLFGALVGGAYLYFFLFRGAMGPHAAHDGVPVQVVMPLTLTVFADLAALGLALGVALYWLLASAPPSLAFSEAEIAFLFPAPLSRTTLIHYGLLRRQAGIAFSALLLGLLRWRGALHGTGPWQFMIGTWVLMSMIQLHGLGIGFTRQRLFDRGLSPLAWRGLVAGLVLLVVAACAWSLRGRVHWPTPGAPMDQDAMQHWFAGIVGSAPLRWLLAPLHWVVDPLFAHDGRALALALGPAIGLLLAHYFWVVRSQVTFEDAAIAQARRRADKLAAMRAGRLRERAPTRPRREPFRLAARGFPMLAFLWKGLLGMGSFFRLRTWVIACVVVIGLSQWMAADPVWRRLLVIIGTAVAMSGAWLLLLGPMMFQRGLRRTLERMDVLKAAPLRGWQIALGELLAPIALMSFAAWLLLLIGAEAMVHAAHPLALPWVLAGSIGAALLAPPLSGLMLSVPFAGVVYFPAWFGGTEQGGRGLEQMGQRMIFMAGYVVILAVCLLPAALLAGLGFLLAHLFGGMTVALSVAALIACAALVFELACAVDLLGRRIDRFDLSQELR